MAGLVSAWGRDLRERVVADALRAGAPSVSGDPVTADDVARLPQSVQRYLGFMGVVGRPPVGALQAHFRGRFRMRAGQRFMPCESWQYNTVSPIARTFWMRIDVAGFVPMVGRDSYQHGRGRMVGKLLDVIIVAEGRGEEFDIGELTTWLNDAVMFAPSMLLTAGASFTAVDDTCFDVSVSDAGRTVTARVFLDARGAPVDFRTRDRYADLPAGLVRAEWSTPVEGWTVHGGHPVPTRGSAVWHLDQGDLTYAEFEFHPGDITHDPTLGSPLLGGTRTPLTEALSGAAQIVGTVLAAPVLRRAYNRWGTREAETSAPMPGDDLVPSPKLLSTRAITIDAPPKEVWPWLAQIGQGRGGLYSFDGLENLVGCDIHSADRILADHQELAPGDLIRLGRPGYPCFRVVSVEPGRSLVLIAADTRSTQPVPTPVTDGTGATWQWTLQGVEDGARTRLVSRQRITYPPRESLLWHVVEPIGFVMERQMLRGLQARASRGPDSSVAASTDQ